MTVAVTFKLFKHNENLGTWFYIHMSMDSLIGKGCSEAFRGLNNIMQIRNLQILMMMMMMMMMMMIMIMLTMMVSFRFNKVFNSYVCYIAFRLLQLYLV